MYYGNDPIKKQQYEELSKLVNDAYAAVKVCTDFADQNKLSFTFDVAYGMGGSYSPKLEAHEIPPKPEYGTDEYWDWYDLYSDGFTGGWSASSHSC